MFSGGPGRAEPSMARSGGPVHTLSACLPFPASPPQVLSLSVLPVMASEILQGEPNAKTSSNVQETYWRKCLCTQKRGQQEWAGRALIQRHRCAPGKERSRAAGGPARKGQAAVQFKTVPTRQSSSQGHLGEESRVT